jgi:sugar transferase (PEP-CTERM/EpsH1 system associated)
MLFLSTRFPFPPIGGERLRPFYFLKYLSRYWKITILSFSESEEEARQAKGHPFGDMEVDIITLPRLKSYWQCALGLLSHKPLEFFYYAEKKMQEAVRQKLKTGTYDLIFCHLIRMAPYVEDVKGIKKVLDICDALSIRYELSSRYRKGPFKFVEWSEAQRLKMYEPMTAAKFDLNIISSSLDKHYLEARSDMHFLEVIENGIEPEVLNHRNDSYDLHKIVFFGNFRIFHNVDAVKYFYERIFPLIKQRIKDVKFVIVGISIPSYVLNMKNDNSVSIYEDAADIRPFIEDACISIAPMRVAAGIQNKILQSMAYGVPVVTTSLGLGGISAERNNDILVADTPEDFAADTIMLMQDNEMRKRIRDNAYSLIKKHYLWPDICHNLNQRLTALCYADK